MRDPTFATIAAGCAESTPGLHSVRKWRSPLPSGSRLPRSASQDASASSTGQDPARHCRCCFPLGCAYCRSYLLHSRFVFPIVYCMDVACLMRRFALPRSVCFSCRAATDRACKHFHEVETIATRTFWWLRGFRFAMNTVITMLSSRNDVLGLGYFTRCAMDN